MSTSEEVGTFRLERSFAAPPVEVFDAWTNPAVLERWWAARPTWSSPGCEVDLRVGGRYRLRMRDDQSEEVHVVGGEYLEVDRPRRLVYTWCWEDDEGLHPGHVSVVSVDFRPAGNGEGTTLVLEHSGLASEESLRGHGAGWQGCLESLARRIFGEGEMN
jgi:uncharacterized protein YndB with AHSA1/START domain